MNIKNDVIESIGKTLNITRGKQEEESIWKARIIYSAAGRMALASLWDVSEEEEAISITHFKRRAYREIRALISANKKLERIFGDNIKEVPDEIYEIYLNTGYLYHTINHIEPIPETAAIIDNIILLRGCALQEDVSLSGIGLYSQVKLQAQHKIVGSVNDLFQLPQIDLKKYVDKLFDYAKWRESGVADQCEYLKVSPPFSEGYWCGKPDITGNISLLRTGQMGRFIYYLYRFEKGVIVASQLPQWMTDRYEYRQIANGLLSQRNVLPATVYWNDGELIHFNIGYIYPPRIQNFIKLYSWPEKMNYIQSNFRRVMSNKLFDILRMSIEPLGYSFIER